MPRKHDHAAVIAAYEELKNGRAVARQLNIHEQTVYQILRRANHQCLRCGKPVPPGVSSCDACKIFDQKRIGQLRKERRRLGLCQECDEPYELPSKTLCKLHRLTAIQRNSRYAAKKQNAHGSPEGSAPNLRQKLRSIRDNYGDNGVLCFNEANGLCEICSISYEHAALHIHHKNCDETDHSRKNLVCLCFHCHKAVHQLLDLRNRKGLINWYEQTYIDKPLR